MSQEKVRSFVEEYVPRYMREGGIPGFSIAVIFHGEPIYLEGFGSRDRERSLPSDPDTLYGIGSCTKSFVAMAVMQLQEKGLLSVDDPATEYIPLEVGLEGKPILIRNLLTHSLGLPSVASSTVALHRGVGLDTGIPWGGVDDFYRLVNGAQQEIVSEPGERFFYHNAGYRMLGHIIQNVSGVPFHEYITDNIIRQLDMERTTMVVKEFLEEANRMTPYWRKPSGEIEASRFPYPDVSDIPEFSFISAAGGVISCVRELLNYLEMNMRKGEWKGRRIVDPESIEEMQSLQVERSPGYYGRYGYGYGWGITPDFNGYKMVSHGGSILVSTAYLAMIPELDMGVAMAANTSGPPYAAIAEGVLATLMDMDPLEAVPQLSIKRRMKQLCGTYRNYIDIEEVEVVNRSGMLYLEQSTPFTETKAPLIPEDPKLEETDFYIMTEGNKQPVEFDVKEDGSIDLYLERYVFHKKP
ncbi:MAG: serine hydrolase [Candidatus Bathyarchaeia archaeon]